MASAKNIILRIGLVWRNPTKIQMLHLSNALYVGKENLIEHRLYVGNEGEAPDYVSDDWLKNMKTSYDLSIYDAGTVLQKARAPPPDQKDSGGPQTT
jgi:hypothetical protein